MANIRQETISGIKWGAISKYSKAAVTFLLGIVLARLISPKEYGILGMIAIFFAVAEVFIDSGFATALIRKKEEKPEDISTVFFYNLGLSFFFYIVLFFSSPLIAKFFKEPILIPLVRVAALSLIIGAFCSVQKAIAKKRRDFKTGAIISIVGTVLTTPVVLYFAYKGYGVWALVIQQLFRNIVVTILYWFFIRWLPTLTFSKKSFKEFFAFGNKMVATNLLTIAYANLTPLFIGKFYSPTQLGYYTKGSELASTPSSSFFSVIMSVTFPILSNVQDNNETLFRAYSKFIKTCSIIIFFVMIFIIVMAKPLVLLLYSDIWAPSIIFVQLFSCATMFTHIGRVNSSLMLVKGRSDVLLKIEIFKKIILFSFMAITLPFGVIPFAIGGVVASLVCIFLNIYYSGKLYGLTYKKQASDFFPYLLIAAISCLPAFAISFINVPNYVAILLGGAISTMVYVIWLWKRRDEAFIELIKLIPERLRNKLRIPV
ncbi:MAG: lipopolysaccharide biosynthesis protein [Bacteroidales bacterium]|nr:lipopolysaccharide biosynthesis protein [Bacteroidales bacterium]